MTFSRLGWHRFSYDPALADWAEAARRDALNAVQDEGLRARWLTCEGTWFVGVDALGNAADGSVNGVPLRGAAVDWITGQYGAQDWHRAQVSVVWPGYPRPRDGESEANLRYRQKRDAAHVDGLRAMGPDRRRRFVEPHAFILGLPLNDAPEGASPLVVWEGSHAIIRDAFRTALAPYPRESWGEVDLTEVYQDARQRIFDTCCRVEVTARPGEAYVVHRLALHGVAPWTGPQAEGRMIAYFRPELPSVAASLGG
ncbi:hypothetical protein [Mesobacterium pallidum]|uniref:hypothetical protein n=1 Tax=Mesobacterium pallidum TaxID=2872037 RepID=UPI001EE34DE2|nr:hypothetical protein [Mesobacterium pallidum]